MAKRAISFTVKGVVQGVGFRPFVYRIARRLGLAGWVTNTPGSVVVRIEGEAGAVARFRELLAAEAPPAARIASITARPERPAGLSGFTIRESEEGGTTLSTIPPDIALCPACLADLFDPAGRRHRYPFVNCTNCGPRFTIVRRLPYDRENTSMAPFALCSACRREYEDPADRRFHAEPNACPVCGPRLWVAGPDGRSLAADDPLGRAASALLDGRVVAVRGLGGFHLAVDATFDPAVRALRARKFREEKPFAVMVRDLPAARALARLSGADARILASPSAPVLLAEGRTPSPLAPAVSSGLRTVGLFLPYTPLHRLLVERAGRPLVMTSGNRTDEPIAAGNAEALERLRGIADLFLLHDREIVQRTDDSVVRRVGTKVYPVRRARGFVPAPLVLARRAAAVRGAVAGLGGEIKSTFCIFKDRFAWLSQHIGDLAHAPVRDLYAETFAFFREFLDAKLAAVCRDLHPGYFTTAFAERLGVPRILPLQHHKAHLYALMAESDFSGEAVGVSFDGTGYGEDGAIWGGELFEIRGMEMRRAGSLDDFPLQGGDSTVRDPWKTALSLLRETFGPREGRDKALSLLGGVGESRIALVLEALEKGINTAPTSSCGRLFDGVSALAGVCPRASYEGQAPMLLEGHIGKNRGRGSYGYGIRRRDGRIVLDWRGTVRGVAADVETRTAVSVIAQRFHDTVARMIADACARIAEDMGTRNVLLSGGVFQNVYLLGRLREELRPGKYRVLIHRKVPANDGGISLGQAYYAARVVAGG